MERSLLKEINKKSLDARVKTNAMIPMYFPNFFGTKRRGTLKWETLTGSKGIPVKADIISYNASGGEKTRQVVSKMSGDIPKTYIKRSMDESDMLEYKQLSYDATATEKEILDTVFRDVDFCFTGVRAQMEFLCMQALSKGEITLTKDNNNGVVTAEAIDFGVPSENKTAVSTLWSTAASATGIKDILSVIKNAKKKGYLIKYVVMRDSDFESLMDQTSTATALKNYINNQTELDVSLATVNKYIGAKAKGCKIVVVDPWVKHENNSTHKQALISCWEEGRIAFLTDVVVGDIQYGPMAEEDSETVRKKAVMNKQDFILTTKWSTLDPFKEWTKSEANAFPVLNDPESIFYLKVNATSW